LAEAAAMGAMAIQSASRAKSRKIETQLFELPDPAAGNGWLPPPN
jgi:hypothetical protein